MKYLIQIPIYMGIKHTRKFYENVLEAFKISCVFPGNLWEVHTLYVHQSRVYTLTLVPVSVNFCFNIGAAHSQGTRRAIEISFSF